MYPPQTLDAKRLELERKILRAIGEFESDTGLHVTKIELQARTDPKSGIPRSERVHLTTQIC